jgi:hypothetical protein
MCYILCMCVCVGASDTTTASDDPSPVFAIFSPEIFFRGGILLFLADL